MITLILSTATRYLLPLLLLLSFYLLVRGHDMPGGGFVGGLVAAAAFALYAISEGVSEARRALRIEPRTLIGLGMVVAVTSGSVPLFLGLPFMTGVWSQSFRMVVLGKIGSPMFFDIGVFMVVVGVTLLILYSLAEE